MKIEELINRMTGLGKDFFSIKDLQQLFPGESNLKMSIKRLVDRGAIVRIARGIYCLKTGDMNTEKIATQIYAPSYISFESALSKYGVINQGFNNLTLATTRHSHKVELLGIECEYICLKPKLFFGFNLLKDIYLAEPEKALLDEIYLVSLGKRKINRDEWNVDELNKSKMEEFAKSYPPVVGKMVQEML